MNRIAGYDINYDKVLGSGAVGTVFEALHKPSGTKLAAKHIFGKVQARNEQTIIKALQGHEHIIKLYHIEERELDAWIFLENCNQGNLDNYLRNNTNLELRDKIKIMHDITSAVAFMHKQNPPIIHRDIKLLNILVKDKNGTAQVRLSDFGDSKICDNELTIDKAFRQRHLMNTLCGTPYFMAPEFFMDFGNDIKYDATVDTFALGLVHLVVLESKENSYLVPLSVEAKQSNRDINIGKEMVENAMREVAMPTVIQSLEEDCNMTKRLKRIILYMTKSKPFQRKDIDEVEEELKEILGQLHAEQNDIRHLKEPTMITTKNEKMNLRHDSTIKTVQTIEKPGILASSNQTCKIETVNKTKREDETQHINSTPRECERGRKSDLITRLRYCVMVDGPIGGVALFVANSIVDAVKSSPTDNSPTEKERKYLQQHTKH